MSLEELGALRVAIVSVSPLANLLAGVRTLGLAHLAGLREQPGARLPPGGADRPGAGGGRRRLRSRLVLLPDRWGSELFGETWAEAAALVGIVALAEVMRLPTFAAIDLVKVLGATRGPGEDTTDGRRRRDRRHASGGRAGRAARSGGGNRGRVRLERADLVAAGPLR